MHNQRKRVLTGITTSGTPHLGNYSGAIRPAIEASKDTGVDAFFFLADFHALIKCADAERVKRSRLEIAATWLAAGLDPERVTFYRQSDVPEIPELSWILTCICPKGLMNRAHAYKACVDSNQDKGVDLDDGVTMGLYSYPILMAADILMFKANQVPVGRDQIQHIEMARDIAQRFNHHYGKGRDYFVLPEVLIDETVATLPGLDGRKMSKSYNNTIPLFEGSRADLKAAILRIQTDSLLPGEPKEADSSHLFTLYRAFATPSQANSFAKRLAEGLGWGEAKDQLFEHLDALIEPMRMRYQELMSQPSKIEDILQEGAIKARALATPFLKEIRQAVGLCNQVVTSDKVTNDKGSKKASKGARFVSFRNDEKKFQFRLIGLTGQELLCSIPLENPQETGLIIAEIQKMDVNQAVQGRGEAFDIFINGRKVAYSINAQADWKQCLIDSLADLNK